MENSIISYIPYAIMAVSIVGITLTFTSIKLAKIKKQLETELLRNASFKRALADALEAISTAFLAMVDFERKYNRTGYKDAAEAETADCEIQSIVRIFKNTIKGISFTTTRSEDHQFIKDKSYSALQDLVREYLVDNGLENPQLCKAFYEKFEAAFVLGESGMGNAARAKAHQAISNFRVITDSNNPPINPQQQDAKDHTPINTREQVSKNRTPIQLNPQSPEK